MKKILLSAPFFLALAFGVDAKAQDPTVKQNSTVTTPERKDQQNSDGKKVDEKGTSEKMSIGEEGDANDKDKKSTKPKNGTTSSPEVKPNSTRNPKE